MFKVLPLKPKMTCLDWLPVDYRDRYGEKFEDDDFGNEIGFDDLCDLDNDIGFDVANSPREIPIGEVPEEIEFNFKKFDKKVNSSN